MLPAPGICLSITYFGMIAPPSRCEKNLREPPNEYMEKYLQFSNHFRFLFGNIPYKALLLLSTKLRSILNLVQYNTFITGIILIDITEATPPRTAAASA